MDTRVALSKQRGLHPELSSLHMDAWLLLYPPKPDQGLPYVLGDYDGEDICAGHQVPRLDFFTFVDAIFVQPRPGGNVQEVEEEAENPIGNDWGRECQIVVWNAVKQLDSVGVVDGVVC